MSDQTESLKLRGSAAAMLVESLTVCLCMFVVSCCMPCWTAGTGWATRVEGEECTELQCFIMLHTVFYHSVKGEERQ